MMSACSRTVATSTSSPSNRGARPTRRASSGDRRASCHRHPAARHLSTAVTHRQSSPSRRERREARHANGMMIGVASDLVAKSAERRSPGSQLVMYTDDLVERRDRPLMQDRGSGAQRTTSAAVTTSAPSLTDTTGYARVPIARLGAGKPRQPSSAIAARTVRSSGGPARARAKSPRSRRSWR